MTELLLHHVTWNIPQLGCHGLVPTVYSDSDEHHNFLVSMNSAYNENYMEFADFLVPLDSVDSCSFWRPSGLSVLHGLSIPSNTYR